LNDRWHQPYRSSLVPGLANALGLAGHCTGLYGKALSGAGPSITAFVDADNSAPAREALEQVYKRASIKGAVRPLAVAARGVEYL